MADLLSRRGFSKATLVGAIALSVPRVGAAQGRRFRFRSRLEPQSESGHLQVKLYLRHGANQGVELPSHAFRLEGVLKKDEGELPVSLHPLRSEMELVGHPRSRAGARRVRRMIVVPPDEEAFYGTFRTPTPVNFGRGVREFAWRTVLEISSDHLRPDERNVIQACQVLSGNTTLRVG